VPEPPAPGERARTTTRSGSFSIGLSFSSGSFLLPTQQQSHSVKCPGLWGLGLIFVVRYRSDRCRRQFHHQRKQAAA